MCETYYIRESGGEDVCVCVCVCVCVWRGERGSGKVWVVRLWVERERERGERRCVRWTLEAEEVFRAALFVFVCLCVCVCVCVCWVCVSGS